MSEGGTVNTHAHTHTQTCSEFCNKRAGEQISCRSKTRQACWGRGCIKQRLMQWKSTAAHPLWDPVCVRVCVIEKECVRGCIGTYMCVLYVRIIHSETNWMNDGLLSLYRDQTCWITWKVTDLPSNQVANRHHYLIDDRLAGVYVCISGIILLLRLVFPQTMRNKVLSAQQRTCSSEHMHTEMYDINVDTHRSFSVSITNTHTHMLRQQKWLVGRWRGVPNKAICGER